MVQKSIAERIWGKCIESEKPYEKTQLQKALEAHDWSRHEEKGFAEQGGYQLGNHRKLSNHENVSMDILLKICDALQVDVSDIVEFLDSSEAE